MPLYPRVPGAEEKVGVEGVVDLKSGGGPADGGGRGGSEAWAGAVVDEEEVCDSFKPGGGGYDMMNGCAVKAWVC